MKASSYFGGQYLSVADLDGKPITAKITAIGTEVLEGNDSRERERIILHLESVEKPIVLNATNGSRLIDAWGDETDVWVNHKVSLSKGRVMFKGKWVDSLVIMPVNEKK